MPKSGQAGVVVALPLPERSGSERAIGAVLNSVLGGGYSSRLNQEIRIKRGLSYGAGSTLDARREAALFRVAVQTKNESAAEVVGLVQAEIDRLMKEADPRRRARCAQAHPDRRLQPQRRDDRRAGRGDPHAWSSRTGRRPS